MLTFLKYRHDWLIKKDLSTILNLFKLNYIHANGISVLIKNTKKQHFYSILKTFKSQLTRIRNKIYKVTFKNSRMILTFPMLTQGQVHQYVTPNTIQLSSDIFFRNFPISTEMMA